MENPSRLEERAQFLAGIGLGRPQITPLKLDASSRLYFRVIFADGSRRILMDDEGCRNKIREFAELSDFFRRYRIHTPKVFAADFNRGFLLLEDLGDATFTKLLNKGTNEEYLYTLATQALIKIARITERPNCCKELTKQRLIDDICFFVDWYFPMATGYPLAAEKRQQFVNLITDCVDLAYKVPNRIVLWDYHVDNIMLPDFCWHCAVIDFQDALWGPLTYDIMSLLEDARREVSPAVVAKMKEQFLHSLPDVSAEDFADSFAFLSMFRHMRVLGRFTILAATRGKDRYLQFVPHLWKMLNNTLQHPKLQPIKQWLDANFPPQLRQIPRRKPLNQAIILAAGRGSRMHQLTDDCPKPLIKIADKALIDYNIERLQNAGINNMVVTLCYKGEMIKKHITQSFPNLQVTYSPEAEALETGGGVKNALPLLQDECFFVCNSDVFFCEETTKPALWRMMDAWDKERYDILLLLQENEHICGDHSGDYRINADGKPERNTDKTAGFPYMFGGISIVNRHIFDGITAAKFSLRDLFDAAEKAGRLGFVVNKSTFFHIGTPEALEEANLKINRENEKKC